MWRGFNGNLFFSPAQDNTGTKHYLINSPFMTKHWHDTTQSLQDK